jgi:hypothetical protein
MFKINERTDMTLKPLKPHNPAIHTSAEPKGFISTATGNPFFSLLYVELIEAER